MRISPPGVTAALWLVTVACVPPPAPRQDGGISGAQQTVVSTTAELETAANFEFGVAALQGTLLRSSVTEGLGAWSVEASLPSPRNGACSVGYRGALYTMGGQIAGGAATDEIVVTPVSEDGALGASRNTLPLPRAVAWMGCAVWNGRLYVAGGELASGTPTAEVWWGEVDEAGEVTGWTATTSLDAASARHPLVAAGGLLYLVGGREPGGSGLAVVRSSEVNPDGSVGAWASSALPSGRFGSGATVWDGRLYVAGGTPPAAIAEVLVSRLGADGQPGAFVATTPLPNGLTHLQLVAARGQLHAIGGHELASRDVVWTAPILGSGEIGAWRDRPLLPAPREGHSAVAYRGRIFLLGGAQGTTEQAQVFSAGFGSDVLLSGGPDLPSYGTGGRASGGSVATMGFLYAIAGGDPAPQSLVQLAGLGAQGTAGAWAATQPLNAGSGRVDFGAAGWNGWLYATGGVIGATQTNSVEYAVVNVDGTLGAWTLTANPFATPRQAHSTVAYNDFLYVVGGMTGGGVPLADVQFAPVLTDGDVGSWSATTPLPSARYSGGLAVYAGRMYLAGGRNAGSTGLTEVISAPIAQDGTLGAWISQVPLPVGRSNFSTLAHNGVLYAVGGTDNVDASGDIYWAPIQADGTLGKWRLGGTMSPRQLHGLAAHDGHLLVHGGANNGVNLETGASIRMSDLGTVTPWTSTTPLSSIRRAHAAVAANGFLYSIGRRQGFGQLVEFAPIQPDGTLGAWTATAPMPGPRWDAGAVYWNGYVYVTGGDDGSLQADVWHARQNPDGTLGPWVIDPPLRDTRASHAMVADNGFLYVVGGYRSPTFAALDEVEYAPILPDGSPGTWALTTSFNGTRYRPTAAIYNRRLYVIAGGPGGGPSGDVQLASINPDGSLGSFTPVASLPVKRRSHTSLAWNGFLYVVGGNHPTQHADVLAAPIHADGMLGGWTMTASLPSPPRSVHASAFYDGRLYVHGGYDGTSELGDVLFTSLRAPEAEGTYSRLFDLGGAADSIDSIRVEGSTSENGPIELAYRLAPPGGTFGALVDLGVVPRGTPIPLGAAGARYVWVRLRFDDRLTTSIVSSGPGARDVTEIALAYTGDFSRAVPNDLRVGCACGAGGGGGSGVVAMLWMVLGVLSTWKRRPTRR